MSKVSDDRVRAARDVFSEWYATNAGATTGEAIYELARDAVKAADAAGQHTECAVCREDKPTPLRIDQLGGYVCLTCIDRKLSAALEVVSAIHEAEPVVWRWRYNYIPNDRTWRFQEIEPHWLRERRCDVEPLYAHPSPIPKGVTVKEWRTDVDDGAYACHVEAARWDEECGEWLVGIIMAPPGKPWTHWRHLGPMPDGLSHNAGEIEAGGEDAIDRVEAASRLRQWVRKHFGPWITHSTAKRAIDEILPTALEPWQ